MATIQKVRIFDFRQYFIWKAIKATIKLIRIEITAQPFLPGMNIWVLKGRKKGHPENKPLFEIVNRQRIVI